MPVKKIHTGLFGRTGEIAVRAERSDALSSYLKNRNVNHPKFSISILAPSRKFSGPCSINTTQQKVAIAKKASQSTQRKYRTPRSYPATLNVQRSTFGVHRLAAKGAVRTSVTLMGQDIGNTHR